MSSSWCGSSTSRTPDPTGLRHRPGHCVTQTTTQKWNHPCAPMPRVCLIPELTAAASAVASPSADVAVAAGAAAGLPAPVNAETLHTTEVPHVWRVLSFRGTRNFRANQGTRRGQAARAARTPAEGHDAKMKLPLRAAAPLLLLPVAPDKFRLNDPAGRNVMHEWVIRDATRAEDLPPTLTSRSSARSGTSCSCPLVRGGRGKNGVLACVQRWTKWFSQVAARRLDGQSVQSSCGSGTPTERPCA